MLTRLRVSGFKNLVDVDVSFGPFTCIAGVNGVGKSNLLDAIDFLSKLADLDLADAALKVRDQGAETGDIRGLFHRTGDQFDDEMSFEAEMLIPSHGTDDLNQPAEAHATLVKYCVSLRYKPEGSAHLLGSLELVNEELKDITGRLLFPHSQSWRDRVVKKKREPQRYISTEGTGPDRSIVIHRDPVNGEKPQAVPASVLPCTILSSSDAAWPTVAVVRQEMRSWRLLQLEPSALRRPDNFTAPSKLASDGAHLPATLFRLANSPNGHAPDADAVYAGVANRLAQLIDDVRSVYVDRDNGRQLLTFYAQGHNGTAFPARALSDGTLRFLALTVLSMEPQPQGAICVEEPENGIHPGRIPAMIQLLSDLAANTEEDNQQSEDSSTRQVICVTHSPAVVMQVPEDSLVLAETVEVSQGRSAFKTLQLRCLAGTWRDKPDIMKPVSKGQLLAYLNSVAFSRDDHSHRVIDREEIYRYRLFETAE